MPPRMLLTCHDTRLADIRALLPDAGMSFLVVHSAAVARTASRLAPMFPPHRAPMQVTSLRDAARVASHPIGAAGVAVVGDRAYRYLQCLFRGVADCVVYHEVAGLRLAGRGPRILALREWMTTAFPVIAAHRGGFLRRMVAALRPDDVSGRAARVASPTGRVLYRDHLPPAKSADGRVRSALTDALDAGDHALAAFAFPGALAPPPHPDEAARARDLCPICLEDTPDPALPDVVTSACCRRRFCMVCAARAFAASGERCPWCRAHAGGLAGTTGRIPGMSSTPVPPPAPNKDAALERVVEDALDAHPNNRVLVVTCDDAYTYKVPTNPLFDSPRAVAWIEGRADTVDRAVRAFQTGEARVAVAHACRLFAADLHLPGTTHVVFTEAEAALPHLRDHWVRQTLPRSAATVGTPPPPALLIMESLTEAAAAAAADTAATRRRP